MTKNKSILLLASALVVLAASSCSTRKKGRGCPSVSGEKNVSAHQVR